MYLNEKFNNCLDNLNDYRGQRGWKLFFRNVDRLIELEAKYIEATNDLPVPESLKIEIKSILIKLEEKKLKVQKLTIGPSKAQDYIAIEDLVYEAKEGFLHLI